VKPGCLIVAIPALAWAQQAADPAQAVRAAMAASLEKQRVSVMTQVSAATGKTPPPASSFFTVPWIEPPAVLTIAANSAFVVPPCDPMPGDELDRLIEQNSRQQGVQSDLIRAVISEESGRRPCAVSSKGAQGLMQLMPAIAEQFGVRDPFDPKQNVEAGTKLLKQLLAKYAGDVSLALSAYNAGAGRVDRDGGVPAIPETVNYVDDILGKLPNQ